MSTDRKASYKAPPVTLRNSLTSQEHRRNQALEEQKRRRAERFDSSRQLDFFADLSLGPSDDEADADDGTQDEPNIVREGMAQFANMLPPSNGDSSTQLAPVSEMPSECVPPTLHAPDTPMSSKKRGKRRKGKGRDTATSVKAQGKNRKPGRWADKCMYAELLEMAEDSDEMNASHDGIPGDIETGWVAVTPVPVGKRCLAVTHQASGIPGIAPNVTLRSRVLGKALMKTFPSPLPPHTILDCILDENWRDNGILHVLDVLKWKGQDVGDCETPFRFWWRDTRLSELPSFSPPPSASEPQPDDLTTPTQSTSRHYNFSYPNTFLPVPYHTNTTLEHLATTLIPLTRLPRLVSFSVPVSEPHGTGEMDLDGTPSPAVQLEQTSAEVRSDGMLLYVAQATYEPGTSPLSSWVPIQAYTDDSRKGESEGMESESVQESPLAVFERLVRRRLAARRTPGGASMNNLVEVCMAEAS